MGWLKRMFTLPKNRNSLADIVGALTAADKAKIRKEVETIVADAFTGLPIPSRDELKRSVVDAILRLLKL